MLPVCEPDARSRWRPTRPVVAAPADPPTARPALRWALYALAFTIPIEAMNLGVSISLTRLAGYLFFLLAMLQPALCFRRPPTAFFFFALYGYLYTLLGIFQDSLYWPDILQRVFTLGQLLIFFWVCSNLLREPRVARGTCLALALTCTMFAILQVTGISSMEEEGDRTSMLGQNPNEVAVFYSVGLLALCSLALRRGDNSSWLRLYIRPAIALIALAIVATGSRGGMLGVAAGLIMFAIGADTLRAKVRNTVLVVASLGFLIAVCYAMPGVRARWEMALEGGNMAHREQLYPAAEAMVLEKPLFGWGPGRHLYELGWRVLGARWNETQAWRDTHNIYLYVLTATGIVGFIPFALALLSCLRTAWRSRQGTLGALPLALFITMLIGNLSGTWLYLKVNWLVFAFAVAGTAAVRATRGPCVHVLHKPEAPAKDRSLALQACVPLSCEGFYEGAIANAGVQG